jgi:hypothetical protein
MILFKSRRPKNRDCRAKLTKSFEPFNELLIDAFEPFNLFFASASLG